MHPVWAAFSFLTKIPTPGQAALTEDSLVGGTAFFPLVGMTFGVILYLFNLLAASLFSSTLPPAALILALWVILSGSLHLDGLSDSFDGLGGGNSPEERLLIMKDTGTGTFGLAAVALLLLLKFSLLQNLIYTGSAGQALFLSPVLGRWSMTVLMVSTRYAGKKESLGRPFIEKIGLKHLITATLITLTAGIIFSTTVFLLLPLTLLLVYILRLVYLNKIGGITGDTTGATCELVELFALLFFSLSFL